MSEALPLESDLVIRGREIRIVLNLSGFFLFLAMHYFSAFIHYSPSPVTTATHAALSVNLSVRPWKWAYIRVYLLMLPVTLHRWTDTHSISAGALGEDDSHTKCNIRDEMKDAVGDADAVVSGSP
jgi:hypothetical protein